MTTDLPPDLQAAVEVMAEGMCSRVTSRGLASRDAFEAYSFRADAEEALLALVNAGWTVMAPAQEVER